MKVLSISCDDERWTREHPTLADIEAAIRALDGRRVTLVTLGITLGHHMGIGGGQDGQYVVYMTKDNLSFQTLEDPARGDGIVMMRCGGQMGDYKARRCVSLDAAARAAREFAETGEAAPGLSWSEE